jgi:membrane-bound lytic murein transglycosylase D
VDHPRVDSEVSRYIDQGRYFQAVLDRSGRYFPMMAAILEEEGVPPELAYVPIVESGYRSGAVSHAGASGPWQFMRQTGRRFGLRIDGFVDERRDPEKSTRAAARYLRELHDMFGSWSLSLAAYNTGEWRIVRLREERGLDSFWEMADHGCLHRETKAYVPRVLAAVRVATEPEKHGFDRPAASPVKYDRVQVQRSVTLRAVARMTDTSLEEISELNPALLRQVTPDGRGYELRIPRGAAPRFRVVYQRMVEADRERRETGYRIRRGDTPRSLARRFGVTVSELMRANGWKSSRGLIRGMKVRLPERPLDVALVDRVAPSAPVRLARRDQRPSSRVR